MSNRITQKEVKSFQNEMSKVRTTASDWFSAEYTNSNNRLYSIFSTLYVLYDECVIAKEANTHKKVWITDACEEKGITLTKKPTLHQLLINYAFFVEGVDYKKQQKRLSSYVRVFSTATATEGVDASNIAEWITENGGVENIRQLTSKSAVTKQQRIDEGTKLLMSADDIGSVTTQHTKENAVKANEVVLLVGVQNADGSVSVKHTIYSAEEDSNISGNTAINTALCNVFSKHKEQQRKEDKQKKEEAEVQQSNDISDIVDNDTSSNVSFQNEWKEVA